MPAPKPLVGIRVVADPAALDGATWHGASRVLHFAPDEALGIDASRIELDDDHAIVADEVGYVVLTTDRRTLAAHVEWPLPETGSTSGAVAGVPAKVVVEPDGSLSVYTAAAYAAELEARLR